MFDSKTKKDNDMIIHDDRIFIVGELLLDKDSFIFVLSGMFFYVSYDRGPHV